MKETDFYDTPAQSSLLGRIVSGKVVQVAPFGFFADVGLTSHAFVDLRYIPAEKNQKPRIPDLGEKIEGVIIGFSKNEVRLSMKPEHFNRAPILKTTRSKKPVATATHSDS